MENDQNFSSPPSHIDTSRPSLGFPLGTALLLIVIFTLSGVFSCCYHWDKLRSLRRRNSPPHLSDLESSSDSPSKPNLTPRSDLKKKQSESLTVLMPGDEMPKFIALPCPCEPLRSEPVLVKVEKPPKPPRFPVPLY